MDDGSLCITRRINHRKKLIYLTPQVYLYLQNYPLAELEELKNHMSTSFLIKLISSRRNDGHGHILRTVSVKETFAYLDTIRPVAKSCPSMFYKTDWRFRLQQEIKEYKQQYPEYSVVTSKSTRSKHYDQDEINTMISLKKQGITDQKIGQTIGRSYWSVIYKLADLRRHKRL